jgi:CheY-like chemotaxis protein
VIGLKKLLFLQAPMNGRDVLASIRSDEDLRNIPVVMLTANAEEKNMHRAEALGVVESVSKPFNSERILSHFCRVV